MADILNIVNTILANGSTEYQSRVPLATQGNILEVGNPILTYTSTQNEFLSALVNKIALQVVQNKMWTNPLAILKKGLKPLGLDIENTYTNPATAETYDASGATLLTTKTPDVKTEYFRLNRQDQYTATIYRNQLKWAFTSWDNLNSLIDSIVNSLYSGNYIDEFILMKNLFADAVLGQKMITAGITKITDATTAAQFITAVKTASSGMTYPSEGFNAFKKVNPAAPTGVTTWTPKENQLLIIRSDLLNFIDVNVLAAAFNMGKAEFMGRVLEVDNFGAASSVNAVLLDAAAIQVWDDLQEMTEFYNAKGMYWNYFWNVWQTYGLSVLANAVAFVDDTTAPAAPIITEATCIIGSKTIAGTGEVNAIIVLRVNTTEYTGIVDENGDWSITVPALEEGDEISVTQIDRAGNVSTADTYTVPGDE